MEHWIESAGKKVFDKLDLGWEKRNWLVLQDRIGIVLGHWFYRSWEVQAANVVAKVKGAHAGG